MKRSIGWGKAERRAMLKRSLREAKYTTRFEAGVEGNWGNWGSVCNNYCGISVGGVLCGCCGGRGCGDGVVIRSGAIKVVPLNISVGPNASTAIKTPAKCNLIGRYPV